MGLEPQRKAKKKKEWHPDFVSIWMLFTFGWILGQVHFDTHSIIYLLGFLTIWLPFQIASYTERREIEKYIEFLESEGGE